MRFRTLDFLCKLQVFIGGLIVAAAFLFLFELMLKPNMSEYGLTVALALGIAAGLLFLGLQMIAMAQVFQCLMQIEINTRHE
jgi:hypothetical protein